MQKIWSLQDCNWIRTQNHFVRNLRLNHLAKLAKTLSCTVDLTVCSCHVTYAFKSESTLYSCLNIKVLLAWSKRKIWSLSDWNWTGTQNPVVRKWTLNHLAKLVPCWFHLAKLVLTIECGFTLKHIRDMTRTNSQNEITSSL